MKYISTVAVVLALLVSFPQGAISQEPILDLAVTNLYYVCTSDTTAYLEAEVELRTKDAIGPILTTVEFYLGGDSVGTVVYDVTPMAAGVCHESEPGCDGICPPAEINGQWTSGSCVGFSGDCLCAYVVYKPHPVEPVSEGSTFTATVDSDGMVHETDETNNSMSIYTGPSSVQGTMWGAVKSLYR